MNIFNNNLCVDKITIPEECNLTQFYNSIEQNEIYVKQFPNEPKKLVLVW